jgi:hypothetical protein
LSRPSSSKPDHRIAAGQCHGFILPAPVLDILTETTLMIATTGVLRRPR